MRRADDAILCLDVAYGEAASSVAGAVIASWEAARPGRLLTRRVDGPPAEYEPGAFYKRELPLLLPVIAEAGEIAGDALGAIVVDGYVWLGAEDRPGLGAHLFERLERRVPVIGVAKNPFSGDDWSRKVTRGASGKPLYVTAAGMDADHAAERVRGMHGPARLPTILKLVDRAARDGLT